MKILWDCGVGEKALRLIARFWRDAELVCQASGYYGRPFLARRGVTQGGPPSHTLFNLTVNAIVREWVRVLQEVHGMGLEDVRRLMACFYADDGLIVARDPEDLQVAFDVLTGLFDRVGLRTNTTKTEAMVFLPGRIRTPLTAEAYEVSGSTRSHTGRPTLAHPLQPHGRRHRAGVGTGTTGGARHGAGGRAAPDGVLLRGQRPDRRPRP